MMGYLAPAPDRTGLFRKLFNCPVHMLGTFLDAGDRKKRLTVPGDLQSLLLIT